MEKVIVVTSCQECPFFLPPPREKRWLTREEGKCFTIGQKLKDKKQIPLWCPLKNADELLKNNQ
jgi:hypothetical protein